MDIKTLIFGIFFLFLVIGLFYFITIFIHKIISKIRGNRNTRCNNFRNYNDNSEHSNINTCGINASKAILNAKEKMWGK